MKLEAFLNLNQISRVDFAKKIGVSLPTISRYVTEQRLPHREILARIYRETQGSVTANDFVGMDPGEQQTQPNG